MNLKQLKFTVYLLRRNSVVWQIWKREFIAVAHLSSGRNVEMVSDTIFGVFPNKRRSWLPSLPTNIAIMSDRGQLKILLIGPCRSGKTTIGNFLAENQYSLDADDYHPTVGVRCVDNSYHK